MSTLSEQAQTHVTTDADSGWIDVPDGTNYLDLELDLSVATAAAGSAPAIALYLEGKEADGDITGLYESTFDGPGWQIQENFGPDTDHDVILPPQVRVRWALDGGAATFAYSLTGR